MAQQNTSQAVVLANPQGATPINPTPVLLTVDTTDMLLSAADQAEIDRFKAWWEAKQIQRRKNTFDKLFDIPPEIRNRIYGYAIANDTPELGHNLTNFKLPAITRASKQLRAETLPLFFSNSLFYVNVKSNFYDRTKARSNIAGYVERHAGCTLMKKKVRAIVNGGGPSALIRDLVIKVHPAGATCNTRNLDEPTVDTYIHIQTIGGAMRISTYTAKMNPANRQPGVGGMPYEVQDSVAAIKQATDVAEQIGHRADFKGLTLRDVDGIAWGLKYVMPAQYR